MDRADPSPDVDALSADANGLPLHPGLRATITASSPARATAVSAPAVRTPVTSGSPDEAVEVAVATLLEALDQWRSLAERRDDLSARVQVLEEAAGLVL